jgi:2-succinyl-5-enolpyruvyl-6-hydroxy-3-cyclohexene-1-carboxylate synthase
MVTGDLSFLHDMNGLIMGKTHRIPLVIVLFNNDGGGIFEYLPQRESLHFDYLFATPHGLDFGGLAQLTGLRYCKTESYEAFNRTLAEALSGDDIYLIEVPTDRARSRELHRKYTVMR